MPVFVFHSIEPTDFGRKAGYIAANGYVSLSAAEYMDVLLRRVEAPPRAVVLTFDDGRQSVLTEGLPILQRHGLKGIVFLVPGRTPETNALAEDTSRSDGFLSWRDVRTLVASGLVDIESHSLTHGRIHVSGHVVDTLRPTMQVGYDAMDVPLLRCGGRDLLAPEAPIGTPILESAPRLSEAVRFIEDEALARAPRSPQRFPDGPKRQERSAAIRRELADSKRIIEEHTGRRVRHLCYPWHVSGPTAEAMAVEAGYETAFGGKISGVPITRSGGDVRHIARIGRGLRGAAAGQAADRSRRSCAGSGPAASAAADTSVPAILESLARRCTLVAPRSLKSMILNTCCSHWRPAQLRRSRLSPSRRSPMRLRRHAARGPGARLRGFEQHLDRERRGRRRRGHERRTFVRAGKWSPL